MNNLNIIRASEGSAVPLREIASADIVIVGKVVTKNRDGPTGWNEYFTHDQVEEFWPGADWADINRQANALLAPIAAERGREICNLLEREIVQNEKDTKTMAVVTLAYLRPLLKLAREAITQKKELHS